MKISFGRDPASRRSAVRGGRKCRPPRARPGRPSRADLHTGFPGIFTGRGRPANRKSGVGRTRMIEAIADERLTAAQAEAMGRIEAWAADRHGPQVLTPGGRAGSGKSTLIRKMV